MDLIIAIVGLFVICNIIFKENHGVGLWAIPLTGLSMLLDELEPKKELAKAPATKVEPWVTDDKFLGYTEIPGVIEKYVYQYMKFRKMVPFKIMDKETAKRMVEYEKDPILALTELRYLEVYEKKDGTIYAWPTTQGMNFIINGFDIFSPRRNTTRYYETPGGSRTIRYFEKEWGYKRINKSASDLDWAFSFSIEDLRFFFDFNCSKKNEDAYQFDRKEPMILRREMVQREDCSRGHYRCSGIDMRSLDDIDIPSNVDLDMMLAEELHKIKYCHQETRVINGGKGVKIITKHPPCLTLEDAIGYIEKLNIQALSDDASESEKAIYHKKMLMRKHVYRNFKTKKDPVYYMVTPGALELYGINKYTGERYSLEKKNKK